MPAFGFPYRVGPDGRTGGASHELHVRDMVELVLFTTPGERVNRPEFGTGVRQMVFTENAPELATAAQQLVQSALQRWLSDVVEVRAVDVSARESTLSVAVSFRVLDEAHVQKVEIKGEV